MALNPRAHDRYRLTGLTDAPDEGEGKVQGKRASALAVNPPSPASAPTADAFDAAAFDALPLRDKLDRAAHASLAFKMALIATTDVATASDARIKAALSAAQSVILTKARVAEVELAHKPGPDRTAEHLARWEKLKRERLPHEGERAKQPVIAVIDAAAEKT